MRAGEFGIGTVSEPVPAALLGTLKRRRRGEPRLTWSVSPTPRGSEPARSCTSPSARIPTEFAGAFVVVSVQHGAWIAAGVLAERTWAPEQPAVPVPYGVRPVVTGVAGTILKISPPRSQM